MPNDFFQETALSAAIGCATGFLWSTLAGQADLSQGSGWLFSGTGCVGSAATGATLYGGSRYLSEDRELARIVTGTWYGLQGSASFTNYLGLKNQWYEEPAFNAVALPLNYLAAPTLSTLSLGLAGIGGITGGYPQDPYLISGTLVFYHRACIGYYYNQIGAIGHNCKDNPSFTYGFHEVGHGIQSSIMGDIGTTLIASLNYLFQPHHKKLILEQWADAIAEKTDLTFYLKKQFSLPAESRIDTNEIGLFRVRLPEPFQIEGRTFQSDPPLLFGTNMRGELVLVEGKLAENTNIDGICYRRGTLLQFDGYGQVVKAGFGIKSETITRWRKPSEKDFFRCPSDAGEDHPPRSNP